MTTSQQRLLLSHRDKTRRATSSANHTHTSTPFPVAFVAPVAPDTVEDGVRALGLEADDDDDYRQMYLDILQKKMISRR
jgi:hypothetical protein